MKRLSDMRGQAIVLLPGYCRATVSCGAGARARLIGGWLRAFLRTSGEGQASVEFAMMMPFLLMILGAIFSLGMAATSYQELGQAAFAGSQVLQNGRGMMSGNTPPNDPCAAVATAVTTVLPTWTAGNFSYTVTITDSTGTPHPYSSTSGSSYNCGAAYSYMTQNEAATIKVSYAYKWVPIYLINLGTGSLSQSRTVLVE